MRVFLSAISTRSRSISGYAVSQGVSSGTNLIASVLAARLLGVEDFAAYAVAFLTLGFVQAAARATVGEPLLIHLPELNDTRSLEASALKSGLLLGSAFSVLIGVAAFVPSPMTSAFVPTALIAPLIAHHDCRRYAFFATSKPRAAVELDVLWLVGQSIGFGAVMLLGSDPTPSWLIAAYGAGPALGALVGFGYMRLVAREGSVRSWRIRAGRSGLHLLTQVSWTFAAGQTVNALVIYKVGGEFLGAYRGYQTLLAPIGALASLSIPYSVPRLRRLALHNKTREFTRAVMLLAIAMGSLTLLALAFIAALSPGLIRQTIGSDYLEYADVAVAVGVGAVFQATLISTAAGLRSLHETRRMMTHQVVAGVLSIGLLWPLLSGPRSAQLVGLVLLPALSFVGSTSAYWTVRRRFVRAVNVPGEPISPIDLRGLPDDPL